MDIKIAIPQIIIMAANQFGFLGRTEDHDARINSPHLLRLLIDFLMKSPGPPHYCPGALGTATIEL